MGQAYGNTNLNEQKLRTLACTVTEKWIQYEKILVFFKMLITFKVRDMDIFLNFIMTITNYSIPLLWLDVDFWDSQINKLLPLYIFNAPNMVIPH